MKKFVFLVTKLVSSCIRIAKRSDNFFLNTFGNEAISSLNVYLAKYMIQQRNSGFLGFGFDPKTKDYKVARFVTLEDSLALQILNSRSRFIHCPPVNGE